MPVREWLKRVSAAHERADQEELSMLRARTQEQRVAALEATSRTARGVLDAMSPEARGRALAHRDPLPESSVRALAMLREKARNRAKQ